jgi:hypothetical protein
VITRDDPKARLNDRRERTQALYSPLSLPFIVTISKGELSVTNVPYQVSADKKRGSKRQRSNLGRIFAGEFDLKNFFM